VHGCISNTKTTGMIEMTDYHCPHKKKKLTQEKCDKCTAGPVNGHDCTLGNFISNWQVLQFDGPPVKVHSGYIVKVKGKVI
jgi:hypothetical protein